MTDTGVIYLVGAGPGDPGLITTKGLALVREADAIVADLLTFARLLQEARPEAEQHDAGSLHRGNKVPQAEIERLLIDLAGQGKSVVRLWPGDPFVFGRAAQEMSRAKEAGLRVELVPGVSSAIAAPAYAGAPVTHWEHANSFTVVAGFEPDDAPGRVDWSALPHNGTLVILMPLEKLPEIVDQLLAAGRPAETPSLVVQHGTLPHQKQIQAPLGDLVGAVKASGIAHPAIVVVGQVARLASELAWFNVGQGYPLLGQRVLVTRPGHQAADLMAALRALGAEPISFPTIEIRPMEDTGALDKAILRIGEAAKRRSGDRQLSKVETGRTAGPGQQGENGPAAYDWLALTSANGVAAFWARLENLGLDSRCLAGLRVAAIGPATAEALRQRSIKADLIPEVYTAEGVLEAFDQLGPVAGQRFLLARADIARKTLAEGLAGRGAHVEEIPAYHTVPIQKESPPPAADIVTFTSSSTVQGYVNCLGGRSPAEALKHSRVVCIGPITAGAARELGAPVSAVAEEYTIDGLLKALQQLS